MRELVIERCLYLCAGKAIELVLPEVFVQTFCFTMEWNHMAYIGC